MTSELCLLCIIENVQIGNLGWCLSSSEGGPQVSLSQNMADWPYDSRPYHCHIIDRRDNNFQFNCTPCSCLYPTHTSLFQFGQPNDVWMHKVRVENFYAENTGDDSLAFFNVRVSRETTTGLYLIIIPMQSQASVTNATIKDAFSRSILLHQVCSFGILLLLDRSLSVAADRLCECGCRAESRYNFSI